VLAVAGAFLLLSVQLTVAAHTHPRSLMPCSDGCAQLIIYSRVCPLCLLAFHLPLKPMSSTTLALPPGDPHAAPAVPEPAFHSFVRMSCLSRAPPRTA
jgi:hypothetical protein